MFLAKAVWRQLTTFFGYGGEATYLWPRWLVLRGVGLVYVVIFSGALQEARGLVGPHGLSRVADYCALAERLLPNVFVRILRLPSLLLISSEPWMVSALLWGGLIAAIALVLNLWPRVALFACWATLLSFVGVWREFASTLNDPLMLETALLCIPFAPAGFRPGLGTTSPPRPVAVLMIRWLVIRVMLTAGLVKLFGSDPAWRDFTFMERMYETSPSPTILAYYVYHLPHAWHVGEILFTFAAEILAPLLAIFCGRRGRTVAIVLWILFQAGIQLTGNFAWLNTAAAALGLLLLDDQMIAAGLRRLRLNRLAERLAGAASVPATVRSNRRFLVVAVLLWLHFGLTLYYPYVILGGKLTPGLPDPRTSPVQFLTRDFRSANSYNLYVTTNPQRLEIEFAGTNDNGATWRPYPFRYKPQDEDRMSPFLAPRFGRFEASLQIVLYDDTGATLFPKIARELVEGNQDVIGLFARNPFPDAPPQAVRMIVSRYTFTDRKTQRETGRYWNKVYVGDFTRPAIAGRP